MPRVGIPFCVPDFGTYTAWNACLVTQMERGEDGGSAR